MRRGASTRCRIPQQKTRSNRSPRRSARRHRAGGTRLASPAAPGSLETPRRRRARYPIGRGPSRRTARCPGTTASRAHGFGQEGVEAVEGSDVKHPKAAEVAGKGRHPVAVVARVARRVHALRPVQGKVWNQKGTSSRTAWAPLDQPRSAADRPPLARPMAAPGPSRSRRLQSIPFSVSWVGSPLPCQPDARSLPGTESILPPP